LLVGFHDARVLGGLGVLVVAHRYAEQVHHAGK
jgi:hypothetical protein